MPLQIHIYKHRNLHFFSFVNSSHYLPQIRVAYIMGEWIFQKSRSNLKIQDARKVTCNRFHTEGPQNITCHHTKFNFPSGLAPANRATNRRIAGSIPDGVIGIVRWHNPSGHTTALGMTPSLTEMSARSVSWGPVRRADNLTTFMCWLSWNLETSASWDSQGLSRPVTGLLYVAPGICALSSYVITGMC
jgi:hypothetical protein